MLENCKKEEVPFPLYRVVSSVEKRNLIPCKFRALGMIVTVVGENYDYKQYMLKGVEPCNNNNWFELKNNTIIHRTNRTDSTESITKNFLNSLYPDAIEGFSVTFVKRNTTYVKLSEDSWGIKNIKEI